MKLGIYILYNRLSSLKTLFLVEHASTSQSSLVQEQLAGGGTVVYIISARREFQMLTYLRSLLLLLSALYIIDNLSFAATDESVLCVCIHLF